MKILHVFRTPVGGLFRHVRDLVRGQTALGHDVGIICDSSTGGEAAAQLLAALEPQCRLGVTRLPISRLPGLGDLKAAQEVAKAASAQQPDILHGHGAKGGLYARLAAHRLKLPSVYTPHGGTLHYEWKSPHGAVFLAAEKWLRRFGSGFVFVCDFERRAFDAKIGIGGKPYRIVHNGLWPEEFSDVAAAANATDILYIGELRKLKGVDVLIDAIAVLKRDAPITATIVGDGADRAVFEAQVKRLGLEPNVTFTGAMPARLAIPLGRNFVMPSRAESFPYVILEMAAAGLPIIASRVGGVGEILPSEMTVPADDPASLAAALRRNLDAPGPAKTRALALRQAVQRQFEAGQMAAKISDFYATL